ncbi:tetratricopeptide repeat protein [Phormidium tenue FACHB-886]|nr:tetratricopeptide repeat protein [Phormidium tenue FACHB-886]
MSRSSSPISSDKPLGGRYKVISQLGVGGFGRTFLAEDLHLPGHPRCVVKQLKPQIRSDDTLQMARRCFNTEAQVLYQLGNHDQIPRLLAHFEDRQEFYLAQEFVEGQPLTKELVEGKFWSENQVVFFLKDILKVLAFVHESQVIHRDLKPSNLIRRTVDRRIVLIDFGAVKQVSSPGVEPEEGQTNITISIGTQGYMPNEQLAGKPRFSSDIYAVGILGIQALTGIHPRHLGEDLKGEIAWHHHVPNLHPTLAQVLDRMVRYDFRERYHTAIEALEALEMIPLAIVNPLELFPLPVSTNGTVEPGTTVAPMGQLGSLPLPIADFSEADFTLSADDLTPTALWDFEESPVGSSSSSNGGTASNGGYNGNHTGNHSGAAHNGTYSGAYSSTYSGTSGTRNGTGNTGNTNGTGNTMGTGFTQVVSRPPPPAEQPVNSSRPARWRWGLLLAIALAVGAALVATKVVQYQSERSDPSIPPTVDPSVAADLPPPSDPIKRAAFFVNRAGQLQQKGQYQDALSLYNQAIALNVNSAEAYAGRCETLNLLKRPEEAVVACNDALAYRPDYPEALWSKGNALLQQNRTYEALKIYEEVTFSKPDFANGWVKRGVALQMLGRSAEALTALDEGIRIQRNSAEAWKTRGAALLNLQRYEEAVVALDKALQLNPKDANAQKLRREAKARLSG